jgi:hypothetical protein
MPDNVRIVSCPQESEDIMVCLPTVPMTDAELLKWMEERKVLDEEEAYAENAAK